MSDENKFDGKKFGDNLRDQIHREVSQSLGARPPRPRNNGIIPGMILLTIGVVFLLDHMGLIHADSLWRFWPVILIAIGLRKIFQKDALVIGAGFIVVGALMILHVVGLIGLSWGTIWPLVLIGAGVLLIWNRFETPRLPGMPGMTETPASGGNDTVSEYSLFGGVERRVNTKNFRGGNITAIFGGVELDFRSAEIEGEEATLFVEAVFGGIEITVPERWIVNFQVQSVFAGYSHETREPLPDAIGTVPRKTLVVRGRATFGGISVKN